MQRFLLPLFALSLALNIYLLFFRSAPADRPQESAEKAGETEGGSSGIVVTDGAPPGGAAANAGAQPSPKPEGAAGGAVADSAGKVVDQESGTRYISLDVNGSLAQTFGEALGSDNGDKVSAVFARIFVWKLDLRSDVRKGDRIQLIYRILPDLNQVDIPAAMYESKKHRTTFQAFWYQPPGKKFGSYYDETGKEVPLTLTNSPIVEYEQITALLRDRTRHNGMDFKAPVGSKVISPFKGRVTRMNWNAPNGTCVEIEYPDGAMAKFLHLSRIMSGIAPGKTVNAGEQIAESGNTGHSTAPHLHYQLEKPADKVIDPLDYHGTQRLELPPAAIPDFNKAREKWAREFHL